MYRNMYPGCGNITLCISPTYPLSLPGAWGLPFLYVKACGKKEKKKRDLSSSRWTHHTAGDIRILELCWIRSSGYLVQHSDFYCVQEDASRISTSSTWMQQILFTCWVGHMPHGHEKECRGRPHPCVTFTSPSHSVDCVNGHVTSLTTDVEPCSLFTCRPGLIIHSAECIYVQPAIGCCDPLLPSCVHPGHYFWTWRFPDMINSW